MLEDTRYFVVSSGRSGSTLLSAILAEAGARFGVTVPSRWDPVGGALEHPLGHRAAAAFRRAGAAKPDGWLRRRAWQLHRSAGRRALRALLAEAAFVKCEDLDLVIAAVFKLGFFPKVILSYRRFEDHAISRGLRKATADVDALLAHYCRTYRNGWLLLQTFGGCVVGFDELIDPSATSWAPALAAVTGLAAVDLLAARDRRLGKTSRPLAPVDIASESARLFELLQANRGRAIAASDQALRNWQARQSRLPAPASARAPLIDFAMPSRGSAAAQDANPMRSFRR
jgi:hypothetical protein